MAANLLSTEVNMIGLLQDHVELADLLWYLPAVEELQCTNTSFCHVPTKGIQLLL
jgi:hypothetical protein